MAGVIATVGGVALKPGVSLNQRWYTADMIAASVKEAQTRIGSGQGIALTDRQYPLAQLTHHGAGDDSVQIVGRLTSMSLDETGAARFTADIADTEAGQTIAKLLDTSDGQPAFLDGVSIRGYWKGTVRKVKGPEGAQVETADGIELDGLDYTKSPGVTGAGVDTFAWVDRAGRTETTERVAITESVQEARVTITEGATPETTAPAPAEVRAMLEALYPVPGHVLEDGICVTCPAETVAEAGQPMSKRKAGISGPGGPYADPGYQTDGKQRYQLDTKAHAVAAWRFINRAKNAKAYSSIRLKRIKGRIVKALKKFGVTPSASETRGWTVTAPVQLSESVQEWMSPEQDAARSGSWSVSASNGPVNLYMSSYCMDPADLKAILAAAAVAAGDALASLDPDMDGDVDVPGVGNNSDPDDDAHETAHGDDPDETAPPEGGTDPASTPAAATEQEDPAMGGTTPPAAGTTPAAENSNVAAGVDPDLYQRLLAKETKRLAKKAAREAATAGAPAAVPAAETAPAGTPAPAAAAPAAQPAAGTPAQETQEQRMARLSALADAKIAEAAAREGLTAAETDEQVMARLLEERLVPLRQAQAENGGVTRRGLAAGPDPSALEAAATGKNLQEATNVDLAKTAAAAFGPGARRA
jgi:hypothetical protein